MLQNFLEHLIHLSTEASLGNNSSKDLMVYHHLSCRDDLVWKKNYFKYIKNRSSSDFIHMYLLFQKFHVQLCKKLYVPVICFSVSINEVHWNSGKSLQSTNYVVNAAIEFSRSFKLIQIQDNEIVLLTGSRTDEFN